MACPLFLRAMWRIPFLRQFGSRVFQNSPTLQNRVGKKKHHNRCLESFLAHLPGPAALGCNVAQGDFEIYFRKHVNEALLFLQQEFTEQNISIKKKKVFSNWTNQEKIFEQT